MKRYGKDVDPYFVVKDVISDFAPGEPASEMFG
jgi:hypothetical protein